MNGKFLEVSYIRMLPEGITFAELDEAVDIYMIRGFCTDKAKNCQPS
nr:unnamed protein product [Callosobruchus analis]